MIRFLIQIVLQQPCLGMKYQLHDYWTENLLAGPSSASHETVECSQCYEMVPCQIASLDGKGQVRVKRLEFTK